MLYELIFMVFRYTVLLISCVQLITVFFNTLKSYPDWGRYINQSINQSMYLLTAANTKPKKEL